MAEARSDVPFRIFPGFAVPFVETEIPDGTPLNAALRELFLERESQGDAYRNPAPTMASISRLYESRFDLFHWPEPAVQQLQKFCTAAVFKVVQELNGYERAHMESLKMHADAWFHVSRRGQAFGLHNHPMASWSGVYCVDSGYGDGDPESGELVFMHPALTANMFVDPGVANLALPWAIRPKSYLLRPGQLVLFPSWAMHQVLPYEGPDTRVSVAFNAWFQQAPEPKG